MTNSPMPLPRADRALNLEFPQSLAVFDDYAQAQQAVEFLAGAAFPVENLAIVGTDLKQYERVMGKRTWLGVLANGAVGGVMNGLFLGVLMWLLVPNVSPLTAFFYGILFGVLFGTIVAAISQAMSGRNRDFNSVMQVFATRYEVLCEHRVVAQAREKLNEMPGYRARQFSAGQWGQAPVPPGQQVGPAAPYPQQPSYGYPPQPWPAQGQGYPPPYPDPAGYGSQPAPMPEPKRPQQADGGDEESRPQNPYGSAHAFDPRPRDGSGGDAPRG